MFIKLTKRAAFWSLVDPVTSQLKVHLTFHQPGPVEIDYNSLNAHCKQIVKAGLSIGNIVQVKIDKKPVAEPWAAAKEDPSVEKKGQEDARVEKQLMSAEEFLKGGIRVIRDHLRTGKYGSEYLSRAIEVEKAGAGRKTVIEALEQKLNKIGGTTAVTHKDEEQIEINLA